MTDETDKEARDIGWVPKEEFKGDPEKWVDSENYLRRGKEYLPMVKAENRKLVGQVSTLQGEVQQLKNTLKASQESIDELKKFNDASSLAKAKQERKELKAKLIEARKEGDAEAELAIEEQLDEHDDAIRVAKEKPVKAEVQPNGNGQATDYTATPEWQQFLKDNSWWSENRRMRALSIEITKELAESGELKDLSPAARFARIAAETKKAFGMEDKKHTQKVESSGGGGNSHNDNGGKTYSDLPADVKATCDRQATRLVGDGRAFKDIKSWREHYANKYYE